MAFWNQNKKRREAELAAVQQVARQVMAREPVVGPNARPWRERRTTPSPGYKSVQWNQWRFEIVTVIANQFIVSEELFGTVFPGDELRINGEWRKVLTMHVDYPHPVIEFEPHPITGESEGGYRDTSGGFWWTDTGWENVPDEQTTFHDDAAANSIDREIRPGDWVRINGLWRQVQETWSDGHTVTFVVSDVVVEMDSSPAVRQ